MHGQGRLQRHKNMGLQLQRIVQRAHQGPEAFFVLGFVEVFHGPLDRGAARACGAVGRCGAGAPRAAHRAEPDAAVCSSCHLLTILPIAVISF